MRGNRDKALREAMSEQPIGKHIKGRFDKSKSVDVANTINKQDTEGSSETGLDKEKGPWQTQILQSAFLTLSAGAVAYILSQNNPFGRSS
ncbi:hypothetical protein OAP83_03200 [Rickettsiales bacterium]|nr:hypothetical protein [Rickettsiales bacterium]